MKKLCDKKILFGFILGLIVCGFIGVGATYLYNSNQVRYKDNNVENALNELYESSQKESVIFLGNGSSFNLKTLLPNLDYTKITIDNFIIAPTSASIYFSGTTVNGSISQSRGTSFSKNYNNTTGILTISDNTSNFSIGDWSKSGTHRVIGDVTISSFNVYLVIGSIASL